MWSLEGSLLKPLTKSLWCWSSILVNDCLLKTRAHHCLHWVASGSYCQEYLMNYSYFDSKCYVFTNISNFRPSVLLAPQTISHRFAVSALTLTSWRQSDVLRTGSDALGVPGLAGPFWWRKNVGESDRSSQRRDLKLTLRHFSKVVLIYFLFCWRGARWTRAGGATVTGRDCWTRWGCRGERGKIWKYTQYCPLGILKQR